MNNGDQHAAQARQLLAGTFRAVMSTHSLEHPGYPFGSVVPYMLDRRGLPLLLLSHLSQHTRNVDVDGRCGLTVAASGDGDVQQLARLSAIGQMTRIDPDPGVAHYFDYFPQSRMYFEQLGFHFYRFNAERFHWNAGFATARWFGASRIVRANPLDADSVARICTHMNEDHADALGTYLRRAGVRLDEPVTMVGIDAEGLDLRIADRLQRIPLAREIGDAQQAREVLVEMAR